jgi:uncharacterized membrane protein YozB (DUF420 family)
MTAGHDRSTEKSAPYLRWSTAPLIAVGRHSRGLALTLARSSERLDIRPMEKQMQRNVGFFFVAVLCVTLLGFFPSYFSRFPTFEGYDWAFHVHAAVALTWIGLLIAQAFLIRGKNFRMHRRVAKASYVVMPLLLASFFLMARAQYHKNLVDRHLSEADALAALSRTGLPDVVYIGILYSLGMVYRKRPEWHLRFFTCIGLIMMGPGFGRFAFATFPPQVAGPLLGLSFLVLPVVWLVLDLRRKKSPIPLLTYIAITFCSIVMQGQGQSAWWQNFAGFVAAQAF